MSLWKTKTFAHGVHPPEAKEDTRGMPIRQFPFAPVLVIPLAIQVGRPSRPTVSEGQEVIRGQRIADPDGFLSIAMHAPASGIVRRIGLAPSISGRMTEAIFIEPFAGSTQEGVLGDACDLEQATPEAIVEAIRSAGIVGLGGAGFPTHAKLRIPEGKSVDTVMINGAECEPYLTADHRVMLEQADDIVRGIRYLLKASGGREAVVAVEANKPDAAAAIRAVLPPELPIRVEVLKVKYPQGAEKMLIESLLGREVPSRGLPLDVGVLCFNAASTAEVGRLLSQGGGLLDRVVTVGGPAVKRKGNYRVPLGTPLRFLLEQVETSDDLATVFLGGPMMGQAVSSLDIPIGKGTTGVIALTGEETARLGGRPEAPCIRCGYCLDACPIFLNPSHLESLAAAGQHQTMAESHHLMDCFECGCCTYVCPSHIPLVQHFRVAKAAVRKAAAT
ncbi:MAG: electron transport complex subunit RsxC [Planctomycetaceae bacterium]|nr:MAG: electron transport complex subunit RsxC [Planctomycetaceae bacterium]